MQEKLKAALYIRVSTEEQAEEGQSAPAQVDTLKQYCSAFGISVYDVYMDLGFSGKRLQDRMELARLLQDCKNGSFNLVLVWKISRLSRNLKDLLYLIDLFEAYDVHFTSCSERFDTSTPVGRMTLQLLGSIAEFERNTIVENVKLGLHEFARKGGKASAVLGYDNVEKKLVINEAEAGIVRLIFNLYTELGMNYSSIADYLNSTGFRTKRGYYFRGSSIAYILHNPVYIGINRHRGNTENSYSIRGQQSSIIDTEIWNKAQNSCTEIRRDSVISQHSDSPSLKVSCMRCRKPMKVFYSSSRGKKYVYYRCTECSNYVSIKKLTDSVARSIINAIADASLHNSLYRLLERQNTDCSSMAMELSAIDAETNKLKKSKVRYLSLFEAYKLADTAAFVERISAIDEGMRALEARRQKIIASVGLSSSAYPTDYFEILGKKLYDSGPDFVLQLSAALVKHIEADKDNINIVLYL